MFIELEALARRSPLLITVSGEGDNLRVSVTPTPTDSKTKRPSRPSRCWAPPPNWTKAWPPRW